MQDKLLVINPGSTSTKIALYQRQGMLWQENIVHDPKEISGFETIYSQLPFRLELVKQVFLSHEADFSQLAGTVGRGGTLPEAQSGAYLVDQRILDALEHHPVDQHASNLGAAIAYRLAQPLGLPAYIYDPVTVDEMIDLTRITGLKEIKRRGQGHNLNMRAAALRYCREQHKEYQAANIIVAHLGGGITLSLHSKGRIIDMITDYDGPFAPERAGGLPTYSLLELVLDGKTTLPQIKKKLQRQGGLISHLGTADAGEVEKRVVAGDAYAALVYQAMALSVAKGIASLSVVVDGHADAIVLTGGIAHSQMLVEMIANRVKFIAPVVILPGENEMQALAEGAWRVIDGKEQARSY